MVTLNEVRSKFVWANKHLELLQTQSSQFLSGQPRPYEIVPNRYVENGKTFDSFTIKIFSDPPVELALIIGDFLHNARATLDYLALALTEANLGRVANSNLRRDTAFPIASKIEDFDPKKIRAVAPEVFTIIDGLQPYHRIHPKFHPLHVLRQMSNIDKHRSLHLTFLSVEGGSWWGEQVDLDWARFSDPLEDGTEIAVFKWLEPPEPEMKVNAHFRIQVGVSDSPPPFQGATTQLEIIERFIREDVLTVLEPFLD